MERINTRFPLHNKLAVTRNEDGTYNVSTVGADGTDLTKPKKAQASDLEMLLHGFGNPKFYVEAMKRRTETEATHRHKLEQLDRTHQHRMAEIGARASSKATTPRAVKYPPRTAVRDAEDAIGGDPELSRLSDEDQQALAFNVAARAQALLSAQPGIDAADAFAQALDEERTSIAPGEERSLMGVDWLAPDKKPSYVDRRRMPPAAGMRQPAVPQPGSQASTPRPGASPPSQAGAVLPPAQRKVNAVYETPRGPMKWTGTGWVPAP